MKSKLLMSAKLTKTLRNIIVAEIVINLIMDLFSLSIQGAKMAVEANMMGLSVAIVFVFFFVEPFRNLTSAYLQNKNLELSAMELRDSRIFVDNIVSVVRGRVYSLDSQNVNRRMSDNEIINYLSEYYSNVINLKKDFLKNVFSVLTTIFMAIVSIKVAIVEFENDEIIMAALIGIILAEIYIAYRQIKWEEAINPKRQMCRVHMSNQKNDITNRVPLCEKHTKYMVNRFVKYSDELNSIEKKNASKKNTMNISLSLIITVVVGGIVIGDVIKSGISNLDSNAMLDIIAFSSLYFGTIGKIQRTIRSIQQYVEGIKSLKPYKEKYIKINDVFLAEKKRKSRVVNDFNVATIDTFNFNYKDKEDRTFFLKLCNNLAFNKGDRILLNGKTGAGKSTFLRLFCKEMAVEENRVKFDGDDVFVSYLFHNTSSQFGSNDLLSEITFDAENVDFAKLEHIMKGLTIFEELSTMAEFSKVKDVFQLLKQSNAGDFSEGQMQRLILTRFLYNLEDNVHFVLLDEPTLKLDEKTTEKVVSFMLEYITRDRLVIISTHNVDETKKFVDYELVFSEDDNNGYNITCFKV